jgi:membrane protein
MRAAIARLTQWWERTEARARERSELVDHGFRTRDRYLEAFAGRLAAAIAFYGFFATFALGVIGYSVLGFLLERYVDIEQTVDEFLSENLPVLDVDNISAGAGTAGVLGLVAVVVAGTAWVEALRSSQRRIWELAQAPGSILVRRGLDLVVLLGMALLIGASVAVATGIGYLLDGVPVLRHLGWLLEIAINLLVALALLAALPRLRISPRRLVPPAVAVAVGIFLLNALSGLYIDRVKDNPAYAVVATAAGLLIYLYLFHQLLLAGAAWVATSRHGRVRDLIGGSTAGEPDGGVG